MHKSCRCCVCADVIKKRGSPTGRLLQAVLLHTAGFGLSRNMMLLYDFSRKSVPVSPQQGMWQHNQAKQWNLQTLYRTNTFLPLKQRHLTRATGSYVRTSEPSSTRLLYSSFPMAWKGSRATSLALPSSGMFSSGSACLLPLAFLCSQ